ncbi:MAG: chromate efflux transporter [Actinobacteria bacterium]|nr:chromate efflux transporter [Actinomycetota bacterium]
MPPVTAHREGDTGAHGVPFGEAFRFWLRLGFINFGGPTGQIAIMHHELVERRRWIGDGRFLHALNYCMLLPGPEAQQLAIYVGWLLNGTAGGLAAGILFIVPSFFLMLALSWMAAAHGDVTWVAAIFSGMAAAVVGIVGAALIRVGNRALKNPVMVAVAAGAFLGIFVAGVPFPFVVTGAGLLGLGAGGRWPGTFATISETDAADDDAVLHDRAATPDHAVASWGRAARVLLVGLAAWWVPLLLASSIDFGTGVFRDQAFFFSKAALVTFGGAYAVLAYLNQTAVAGFGWLSANQMVTGLGLAETTPGPLIMVTEFVGFLGAYRFHGDLSPVAAGALGASVAVWATFAPCFLWIFLGAPSIERLRGNVRLTSALSTITAAVGGVIGSLALTFGLNTLFDRVHLQPFLDARVPVPEAGSFDPFAAVVALAVFVGMWQLRWKVVPVVLAAAAAGLLRSLVG